MASGDVRSIASWYPSWFKQEMWCVCGALRGSARWSGVGSPYPRPLPCSAVNISLLYPVHLISPPYAFQRLLLKPSIQNLGLLFSSMRKELVASKG